MLKEGVMGYRIVDTTADVGVEAWGKSLKELFEEAARGLISCICPEDRVEPKKSVDFSSSGADPEDTLISMLNDIIYLHETRKMVFCDVKVKDISPQRVDFTLKGEAIDPKRHDILGVKAATYHNVRIERKNGLYRVRVILDV